MGRRSAAFIIDLLASGLVAGLFVHRQDLPGLASRLPGQWSLLPLFLEYVLGIVLLGRSLGMYLTGLRVVRLKAPRPIGPVRAAARTVLLLIGIPALVMDGDLRGLHDRLTDTAVILH